MQRSVPVDVGDEVDVTIEAVGEKGDGIARKDGFVLFVPNTKEGDNVKVKVTKVLKRVGFAEVVGSGSPAASGHAAEPALAAEAPQDSEDFGEEAEEDPVEAEDLKEEPEEPAEEPEEEPAEEAPEEEPAEEEAPEEEPEAPEEPEEEPEEKPKK
jgi:predicted RNA-binding protein with TRAM domain